MANIHGMTARVYLGIRDASGDLSSVEPKFTAATHDMTDFASGGWVEAAGGGKGWEVAFKGTYDDAVGGYGRQLESLGSNFVLSVYLGDADAIGDPGLLFGAGVLEARDDPISGADMIRTNGSLKGNGAAGMKGRLLHTLHQETVTASESSLDNTAPSTGGGLGNLHVTAVTGSWTITIEQSSDNGVGDPWATLISFTQVTAGGGPAAESKIVTGTVERYLRVTATEDVAGSCTFVCGFARYPDVAP